MALIFTGFVLGVISLIGFQVIWLALHPINSVTNHGFPLVKLTQTQGGDEIAELKQGESKVLPYGEYDVTIPDTKASFALFKNNRGVCDIYSSGETAIVVVNENATILGGYINPLLK